MGVVVAGPKPFAGYGDNTNLLNWLWNLGVPSYHGGSTMVHLGRGGRLHPASSGSLRAALMDGGDLDLRPVEVYNEDELDWNDPKALGQEPSTQPAPGWIWHQPGRMVTGPARGGSLEILHWNLAAGRWIRPAEDYAGWVLLLETSEEMPPAEETFRMLRNFGERGCWPSSRPSWSRWPRPAALAIPHCRRSAPATARSSGRRYCALSADTTREPWLCSTSTSGTQTRSGSCRTAGRSPWTVRPGGSPRTTETRGTGGGAGTVERNALPGAPKGVTVQERVWWRRSALPLIAALAAPVVRPGGNQDTLGDLLRSNWLLSASWPPLTDRLRRGFTPRQWVARGSAGCVRRGWWRWWCRRGGR